ncbi:MAG: ribosome-associated translation inhibitor RaiA [Bacteriovoracaceae bacterium]|jgi:ribosome-associated translation inhibitor RaiA
MKVNIAFDNVDNSDALQFFIQQKSVQVKKLLANGEVLRWVIEQESKSFKPILKLKLRNKNLYISSKARNAFSAVSDVVEKAKRLVNEDHKRLKK